MVYVFQEACAFSNSCCTQPDLPLPLQPPKLPKMTESFMDSSLFTWVVLPLLIFLARIADQTIGTLRLIFLSKGYRFLAPLLGFFEVIIWLVAVSQIMKHLDNVMCYVAYGAGFAMGNYLGIRLDEKLSLGHVLIRIIPKFETDRLIAHLREQNFGATSIDAEGSRGKVKVVLTIIKRKEINNVIRIINQYNPNAFYTIEEVKSINEGIFKPSQGMMRYESLPFRLRKFK